MSRIVSEYCRPWISFVSRTFCAILIRGVTNIHTPEKLVLSKNRHRWQFPSPHRRSFMCKDPQPGWSWQPWQDVKLGGLGRYESIDRIERDVRILGWET